MDTMASEQITCEDSGKHPRLTKVLERERKIKHLIGELTMRITCIADSIAGVSPPTVSKIDEAKDSDSFCNSMHCSIEYMESQITEAHVQLDRL